MATTKTSAVNATATTKALTEVQALKEALAMSEVKANTLVFDKLTRMLEVRENKSSKRTETPKQKENRLIRDAITSHFKADNTPLSATEVMDMLGVAGYTYDASGSGKLKFPLNNQRVSRILSCMREEGAIKRTYDRKTAVFSI